MVMAEAGRSDRTERATNMKQGIFLRAMAADSTEAVIDVVGVIGWEVGYQQVRDILRSLPDGIKRVVFDIYSPGGSVWEGNGIIQDIGELAKSGRETVARVQVAASMATLIAVACDRRSIAKNGRWLIHNPWTGVEGDADSLEKRAKELRDCEREAAEFYAKRTGRDAEEMLALMDEERWLTADEAAEYGFVDEVRDPFDAAAFADVRAEIEAAGAWPQGLADLPQIEEQEGGTDAHADTDGTETADSGSDGNADRADDGAAEIEERIRLERESAAAVARAAGRQEGREEVADKLAALDMVVKEAQAACRSMQSQKDKAIADAARAREAHAADVASLTERHNQKLAELTEQLNTAHVRIAQLLAGSLTYSPAIETWADAMRACGGDYEAARKRYADVFNREIAGQNRRQKGA